MLQTSIFNLHIVLISLYRIPRFHKFVILFLFLIFSNTQSFLLFPQELGNLFIHNYGVREYDEEAQNWSVIQDKRGMIYAGNQNGAVLEFDGVTWRSIRIPNESSVRSLATDDKGRVYVGAVKEFGYLEPDEQGRMEYISLLPLLDSAEVDFQDVWSTNILHNSVFFQTINSVFRLREGKIKTWYFKDTYHRSFVVHEKFYVREEGVGVTCLENDTFKLIRGGEVFADKTISAMLAYPNGKILIGTRLGGLYLYDPGLDSINHPGVKKFECEANGFLSRNQLYHGIAVDENTLAFATLRKGIIFVDTAGNLLQNISKDEGLLGDETYFIFHQSGLSLWVGLSDGISRIDLENPIRYWDDKAGIQGAIMSILRYQGTLYLGTSLGVYYWKNDKGAGATNSGYFAKVEGIDDMAWSLLSMQLPVGHSHEKEEKLLAGTSSGIFEIVNDKAIPVYKEDKAFVLLSLRKSPYKIFAGAHKNLFEISWNPVTKTWGNVKRKMVVNDEIRFLVEDKNNDIWVSTLYEGVLRIHFQDDNYALDKPFHMEHFGPESRLPSKISIGLEKLGEDMAFAFSDGIYRFDEESGVFYRDTIFGRYIPKSEKKITWLAEDSEGNIWTDNKDILFKQPDHTYVFNSHLLERTNRDEVYYLYPEENGIMWLGGLNTLYKYDPLKKKRNNTAYYAFIRKVSLSKDSTVFWGGYDTTKLPVGAKEHELFVPEFPYYRNWIRFEYASSYFIESQTIEYSYKLDGYQDKWSDWSAEATKEYTNLREGEYTFHVKARNIYHQESTVASYQFLISPPWYRTYIAYLFYFFVSFSVIFFVVRFYTYRLKQANIRLERIVKERTAEISSQRDALEEANATKDKFFSIISHDLRGPFNSLLGFAELIVRNFKKLTTDELEEYTRHIFYSSKELFNLIENLFNWSKSKTGRIEMEPHIIDLYQVVSSTLSVLKLDANRKNIGFRIHMGKNVKVWADETLLSTVLQNLISNAIKFSLEGREIIIHAEDNSSNIRVSVIDHGVGMNQESMEKLFREDIYYTTRGTNDEKGSGLGLILCKEFVEKNGGALSVKSEIGTGTTFMFTIPKANKEGIEE